MKKVISECQETTRDSFIKVEQYGRKAVIINDSRQVHIRTRFDGCVVTNTLASDYIITRPSFGDVIIELKGKDVQHATKQVEATAAYWKENGYASSIMAALIVANQYPRVNTEIRKAQERFAKIYKKPLHVVTKNFRGRMEEIFSFQGPYKV